MIWRSLICTVTLLLASCLGAQEPAPTVSYGVHKGAGSAGIHTVLEGDTVYSVSERYHLPMKDIIILNDLSAPFRLSVGYRMKLPPPNEYKVRKGDTLTGIARTFDVSVTDVVRLNNLRSPYIVKEGQVLRLPSPSARQPERMAVQKQNAQNVPTPQNKPQAEQARVQQASTTGPRLDNPPPRAGNGKFMKPVDGKVISSYGPKTDGLYNDGINIQAPRGTPVRAAENGVVVYTGNELEGYGNLVLVRHQDQYMTAYAHLDKTLVKKGDILKRGQSLATVGSTGQVDLPQLHFEVRKGTKAINPQPYL